MAAKALDTVRDKLDPKRSSEAGPCARCKIKKWGVDKCVPIPASHQRKARKEIRRLRRAHGLVCVSKGMRRRRKKIS